jgi:hypothetical protein
MTSVRSPDGLLSTGADDDTSMTRDISLCHAQVMHKALSSPHPLSVDVCHACCVQVAGLQDVHTVAMGHMHSLAGLLGGKLYSWGTDEFGALGRGESSMLARLPMKRPGVSSSGGTKAYPVAPAAAGKKPSGDARHLPHFCMPCLAIFSFT